MRVGTFVRETEDDEDDDFVILGVIVDNGDAVFDRDFIADEVSEFEAVSEIDCRLDRDDDELLVCERDNIPLRVSELIDDSDFETIADFDNELKAVIDIDERAENERVPFVDGEIVTWGEKDEVIEFVFDVVYDDDSVNEGLTIVPLIVEEQVTVDDCDLSILADSEREFEDDAESVTIGDWLFTLVSETESVAIGDWLITLVSETESVAIGDRLFMLVSDTDTDADTVVVISIDDVTLDDSCPENERDSRAENVGEFIGEFVWLEVGEIEGLEDVLIDLDSILEADGVSEDKGETEADVCGVTVDVIRPLSLIDEDDDAQAVFDFEDLSESDGKLVALLKTEEDTDWLADKIAESDS